MMIERISIKIVGAPDPELDTSPIAEETDEDYEILRQEVEDQPVCYFNGESFPNNAYVRSGSSVFRCEYGIWLRVGPADLDNI